VRTGRGRERRGEGGEGKGWEGRRQGRPPKLKLAPTTILLAPALDLWNEIQGLSKTCPVFKYFQSLEFRRKKFKYFQGLSRMRGNPGIDEVSAKEVAKEFVEINEQRRMLSKVYFTV